jgi:Na+/melibiose symporter-like transporter
VWGTGLAGLALLGAFLVHERRTPAPMLPLGLFRRRNFAVGNAQTFAMYGGLGVTFFFLVLFLQQVAGYDALQAGLALMPSTLVMFALSKRAGRLADRFGPRLFMGAGPLVAALGLALMLRLDAGLDYFTDLLRGVSADAAYLPAIRTSRRSSAGAERVLGRPKIRTARWPQRTCAPALRSRTPTARWC